MERLVTVRISQASAVQRAGRAGRTAPGSAWRLWGESAQATLAAQTPPEILTSDLAPLALELAQWGARDASRMQWMDAPPAAALAQARDLLQRLEAIDAQGAITATGRAMLGTGLHPRLAHMLVRARGTPLQALAARLAALLSERDLLRVRAIRTCARAWNCCAVKAQRRRSRRAGARARARAAAGQCRIPRCQRRCQRGCRAGLGLSGPRRAAACRLGWCGGAALSAGEWSRRRARPGLDAGQCVLSRCTGPG